LVAERTYADGRDELREALAELADLADELGSSAATDAARVLDKKLVENRFNVVVFGEFKRGKTTFVNALLGADILPVAVVPLTSIVTAVTWGEEIRARIVFLDAHEEDVSLDDLPGYVTERGNPENRLGVARAIVCHPSEDLRDGVFLIDTPGVGSVYRHNTEAARAFLSESDVVIFLTSADPAISEAERAFLEDVRDQASRLFFVLNKIDYLSGIDRDEGIAFTRGVVADAVGHDIVLYPLSARRALLAKLVDDPSELAASGLPAFEHDFRAFLLDEKGRTILDSIAARALRVVEAERNTLDVQERALQLPVEEILDARRRMEEVFVHARARQRDLHSLLRQETETLVSALENDLAEMRAAEEGTLLRTASEWIEQLEDARRAREDLDRFVKDTLRADIDRWRHLEEQELAASFRNGTARFVEEADQTERETVRLCGEILGIRLASEGPPVDLSSDTRFSLNIFEVPTILESLLPDVRRLLPRGTARRLLERGLKERIPSLVDMYSGRLRWDFVQRLEQSRLELEVRLEGRLEETIGSLSAAIERSEGDRVRSAEDTQRARENTRTQRHRLDGLHRAFLRAHSSSISEDSES
jgi:GTPase Era involved in 16S rRNA processing